MSHRSLVDGGSPYGPLRLLDVDRTLLAAVPEPHREMARRLPLATRIRLPAGSWDAAALAERGEVQPSAVLLVEDGVLVRDLVLAGRASAQLLGEGDVAHPWRAPTGTPSSQSCWTAGPEGAIVAILDERFTRACLKWPGLAAAMQERLTEQLEAGCVRTAIVSLPRAEQRVLGLLWQLAERWGTVSADCVNLHLALTHELIGRLVAARRPTVSLALQSLADHGLVTSDGGCRWRLAHGSQDALDRVLDDASPLAVAG